MGDTTNMAEKIAREIIEGRRLTREDAVSYTHLDVYKRQDNSRCIIYDSLRQ